jgi:hypothetical protein
MRVVLDTNVIVSGLLTPHGAPGQILRLHAEGAFELVASPLLLEELGDVLERPHVDLVHRPELVLAHFRSEATLMVDHPAHHPSTPTDPDDLYLLDLAVNASAILVSGDHALQRMAATAIVLSPRALLDVLTTEPEVHEDAPFAMAGLPAVPSAIDRARHDTVAGATD